jgi:hypothetical protein
MRYQYPEERHIVGEISEMMTKLWTRLTDQRIPLKHFSMPMGCVILSGTWSRELIEVESRGECKKNWHLSPVIAFSNRLRSWSCRAGRRSLDEETVLAYLFEVRICSRLHDAMISNKVVVEDGQVCCISHSHLLAKDRARAEHRSAGMVPIA